MVPSTARCRPESGYTFDHSSAVFLLDRDGDVSAILDAREPQDQRLAKLRELIR